MNRFAFVLIVMIAACGGGGVEPVPQDPPPDVDPNAIPEIIALSMESSVPAFLSTTIAYEVKNARAIEISVGDQTVLSGFENKGSVDSGPLRHDSIVTLTARNREHVATASRMIAVLWEPPVIEDFTSSYTQTVIGSSIDLLWSARNVDALRILRNGEEVLRTAETNGFTQRSVQDVMTTFVLEVSNPRGTVTRELMIEGVPRVWVARFSIQPRAWFGGVEQATLSWDVREATAMKLDYRSRDDIQHHRNDLLGGAFQSVGSLPIEIYDMYHRDVDVLTDEDEPVVVERIADEQSVDTALEPGSSGVRVVLAGPDATGCPFDGQITLHNRLRGAFASSDGCAPQEISADEAFALGVEDPNLYIEVSSDSRATGQYTVLTEEL